VRRIRPYQLFTLLDASPGDRIANIKIPYRRDLKLLETFLLVTSMRLVNAKRIFEFGTFLGSTTFNLALNASDDAQIITLDLSAKDLTGGLQQHPSDAPLTLMHFSQQGLEFEGTTVSHKVTRLRGDSKAFDFSPWQNSVDMIFIDGGHDYATVKSDTENALTIIRKETPACIFWHDYGHPEYKENTAFLDGLADKMDIFHIEDTILCGWFNNVSKSPAIDPAS
jgi:hypothetical protein